MNHPTLRRILAIDAFRGLTLAFMIIVNMPGSWAKAYQPLKHANWHGCTPTDLVFPFFLFVVGISMRYSFEKYDMCLTKPLFLKTFKRGISIFLIGLLLNAFPFIRQDWDWSSLRILGVLQRIGICYFVSSIIVLKNDIRNIVKITIALLIGYWGLMEIFGIYHGTDPYALQTNIILAFDNLILGESHLYKGMGIPFDPEGILSTIPSIATTNFGFLVGTMMITNKKIKDNIKRMIVLGLGSLLIGLFWGILMPINKQLWTSSYVMFTAGIATLFISFMIYIIDIKKYRSVAKGLAVLGSNSIFLFIISGIWTKILLRIDFQLNESVVNGYYYLYKTVFFELNQGSFGSLLFAIFHLIIFWLLLYWMKKKKIFLKI